MVCSICAAEACRLNLKAESWDCVSDTGIPTIGSATVQLCNFVQFVHHPSHFALLSSVLYIWIFKPLWALRPFSIKITKIKRSFPVSPLGTLRHTFALVHRQVHSYMYTHKLQIKYLWEEKQLLSWDLILNCSKWCLNVELSLFIADAISLNWCTKWTLLIAILTIYYTIMKKTLIG